VLCPTQVHLQTFASNADVASAAVVKDRQHLAGDGLVFSVGVSLLEPGLSLTSSRVCQPVSCTVCKATNTRDYSVLTFLVICCAQEPGSWDEAGVGSPVVRCYFGDDEERCDG
jgi:hypothetical protein